MRKSLLLIAVLSALSVAQSAFADEVKAAEDKSDWNLTTNVGFVSDYYARGVSQSWHKPAVQGGIDLTHANGFYTGVWGSTITSNTYAGGNTEIDIYAGYNGQIKAVPDLGYTVGVIGYLYPGASWDKYTFAGYNNPDGTLAKQTPQGGRFDTYEANFGLSYKWLSAKASVTLTDWFGAETKTGWDGSTKGSTYLELNAAYPLPWWNLSLIGHVGYLNVAGKLNPGYVSSSGQEPSATTMKLSPDQADYKVGLSRNFKIANADGWNAGVYYVGATNGSYWGDRGYGGSSFVGSTETKNLTDNRVVLSLTRSF
jgi:uncharacterized protein (TIGR02001 family)